MTYRDGNPVELRRAGLDPIHITFLSEKLMDLLHYFSADLV